MCVRVALFVELMDRGRELGRGEKFLRMNQQITSLGCVTLEGF